MIWPQFLDTICQFDSSISSTMLTHPGILKLHESTWNSGRREDHAVLWREVNTYFLHFILVLLKENFTLKLPGSFKILEAYTARDKTIKQCFNRSAHLHFAHIFPYWISSNSFLFHSCVKIHKTLMLSLDGLFFLHLFDLQFYN